MVRQAFPKLQAIFVLCSLILLSSLATTHAQTEPERAWNLLEYSLDQKSVEQRLGAVRALGIIPADSHAAELAEKALKDPDAVVRAAAATSLGQMHATSADAALKSALNDKHLPVVMAAAHALRLLNDPACYEVYYAIFTGERKDSSGLVAQEMQVLHDPKQVAEMGFNEGIGYVPFAGIGWEALETIMKDRKSGAAAKAALIAALATDPDPRTTKVLVQAMENKNWVLRMAALEAVAKRGDSSVLTQIAPALNDSRHEVQDTAAAAVIHLNDVARTAKGSDKTALESTRSAANDESGQP